MSDLAGKTRRQPSLAGISHWSTDYVEHLRTVHFTLVAACVALIVLSASRAPTEVQLAHAQVGQIKELLRSYDRSWLEKHVEDRIKEGLKNQGGSANLKAILAPNDTVEFQQAGAVQRVSFGAPTLNYIVRNLDSPVRPESTRWERIPLLPDKLPEKPATLQQFRRLWDSLDDLYVLVPTSVSGNAIIGFNDDTSGDDEHDFIDSVAVSFSKTGGRKEECYGEIRFPLERGFFLGAYSGIVINRFKAKDSGFRSEYFYGCRINQPESMQSPQGMYEKTELVTLPIQTSVTVPYDGQSALISHTSGDWNWRHGKFDYAFQQLSEITKNYEDLDVSKIEQVLADEQKRAGGSFEAIGIKFPAENATRWGILVIIGVQLYFWIHLRERSPKLHRSDPGWEVAWIGVYPSKYARAAMFVSTCLLPPVAASALGIRGLQISSFGWDRVSWPYWCTLVFGVLCTSTLGYLAWKRLPRASQTLAKS